MNPDPKALVPAQFETQAVDPPWPGNAAVKRIEWELDGEVREVKVGYHPASRQVMAWVSGLFQGPLPGLHSTPAIRSALMEAWQSAADRTVKVYEQPRESSFIDFGAR